MADTRVIVDGISLRPNPAAVAASPGAIELQDVAGTLKQVTDQGVASSIGGSGTSPKAGTNLTDADQTLQPVTDLSSLYRQVTPLTANRTKTLGTTSAFLGETVYIQREDTANFTLAIVNGGSGAGTMFTFPAAPTVAGVAGFQWDGLNWQFAGFQYVTVSA